MVAHEAESVNAGPVLLRSVAWARKTSIVLPASMVRAIRSRAASAVVDESAARALLYATTGSSRPWRPVRTAAPLSSGLVGVSSAWASASSIDTSP